MHKSTRFGGRQNINHNIHCIWIFVKRNGLDPLKQRERERKKVTEREGGEKKNIKL